MGQLILRRSHLIYNLALLIIWVLHLVMNLLLVTTDSVRVKLGVLRLVLLLHECLHIVLKGHFIHRVFHCDQHRQRLIYYLAAINLFNILRGRLEDMSSLSLGTFTVGHWAKLLSQWIVTLVNGIGRFMLHVQRFKRGWCPGVGVSLRWLGKLHFAEKASTGFMRGVIGFNVLYKIWFDFGRFCEDGRSVFSVLEHQQYFAFAFLFWWGLNNVAFGASLSDKSIYGLYLLVIFTHSYKVGICTHEDLFFALIYFKKELANIAYWSTITRIYMFERASCVKLKLA